MNNNGHPQIFGPKRPAFATIFFDRLHRYKKLVLRHWWIILVAIILGVGTQWLLLRRQAPSFASDGRMIVNVKISIPNGNIYSEDAGNFFGTQVALMLSDSVVGRVKQRLAAAEPGLPQGPVDINVTLAPKTSIFNLRAVGPDPKYTQAYLQATMEEYINLKKDLLINASSATRSSIQDELVQMSLDLEKSKQEYLNFQTSNSVVFLQENGGNSAADYLTSLTRQLAERRSELHLLTTLTLDENLERQQGLFVQPNSTTPLNPPNAAAAETAVPVSPIGAAAPLPEAGPAVDNYLAPNKNTPPRLGGFETAYLQTKQQLLMLKARRDELAQYLKPKHPDLIAINDEIASQERILDIFQAQSQEQLKNRQHTLELEIKDLESQVTEWEVKALDASKRLSEFEVLKENHQRLQAMYDQLLGTLQTLAVDKGAGQEGVTILESATPGIRAPSKALNHLIMGGLIGLFVGAGILLFLDRLDDRPATFMELSELFDKPVLGQFPFVKALDKKSGVPILQFNDDRHTMVEAYHSLRSALIFKHSPESHPRSIVITSACPNDGKSMISANLAITLAQSGSRVLLIDADLRRGVLHRKFRVPESPGLAEVLERKCDWPAAVVPTGVPNLSLMPCGLSPNHPGGLFATQARSFLAEIAGSYDYFIFDTAPVMAADDVASLAPHADGVLMVIRAGFTSGRLAQAALDLLSLRKVNVIGLVFNAVHPGTTQYYYFRDKSYDRKHLTV
jgi:capsular exopolysaccharide synthesis family protein